MPVFDARELDPNNQVEAGPNVEAMVRQQAAAHGLNPDTLSKLAHTESGFKTNAVSPKGAIGPMQLMPSTAKDLGVDPHDPQQNVAGGVQYFHNMLGLFGGDEKKAAAAYNAGPAAVHNALIGKKGIPTETKNYLKNIFPGETLPTWAQLSPMAALASPAKSGKVWDASEFAQAPSADYSLGNAVTSLPHEAANLAAGNLDIGGGIMGGKYGAQLGANLGPAGAAGGGILGSIIGAVAGRKLAQEYQKRLDPEEAPRSHDEEMQQLWDSGKNAVLGEAQGMAMRAALPWAQRQLYTRLTGADMAKAADSEAIAALQRDRIPLGIGQDKAITKWKAPDNKTIDEIVDKYQPTQIPGLVRTGVAGEMKAQQGASMWTGGINKADLQRDYKAIYQNTNIPQNEVEAADKAFENFFGRKGDHISLADAREIKHRIDLKVPFGSETEGMASARKALRYVVAQHMAEAIPDAADRARFLQASGNLETKINAEELADRLKQKGRGHALPPALGYAVGAGAMGASLYFGHSPWPGLAAVGAASALSGPTVPSRTINLLNSPFVQRATEIPTRAAPGQMQRNFSQGRDVVEGGLDRLLEAARKIRFAGDQPNGQQ